MGTTYRCWAEVNLPALRANLGWIRHRVGPGVKVMTVVKADAYGHGLKQIAAHLMQSGTDIFGVANLGEARSIRAVGRGWPILMLGPTLPSEVEATVREEVMPTLSSLAEAHLFSKAAGKQKKTVQIHLKVDTGMGRLGVTPEGAGELFRQIQELPGLQICGIYTHYAAVEDDPAFSLQQQKLFSALLRDLGIGRKPLPYVHANNSGGILWQRRSIYNTVRPGLLVYGVVPPGPRAVTQMLRRHLLPVLSWKCRVGFIKTVPPGASLSYGRTFKAKHPLKVATLTVGYGDGYMRAGSGRAQVLVGGCKCPVLGRITMDQILVDVSSLDQVTSGDEAVLLGEQGKEKITATDLASWCGTIPWEILTNITYRVPRVYRGGEAA